jgi:hypothetical protein
MSDTLNETVPGCTRELLATTLPMPYRAIILPCNIFMSLEGHIDNLARERWDGARRGVRA